MDRPDLQCNTPKVSVLLLDGSRLDYLEQALESVAQQTLARELFETIIVAGTDGVEGLANSLLGRMRLLRAKIVRGDPSSIGRMLECGVRASSGKILAILHDDDVWEPQKLETVCRAFDVASRTGYFKHSQVFIRADGLPLRPFSGSRLMYRDPPRGGATIRPGESRSRWRRLGRYSPDFNSSTIALKRNLLVGLDDLMLALDRNEDTFLFHVALARDAGITISRENLSRYRVHDSNTSRRAKGDLGVRLEFAAQHSQRLLETVRVSRALFKRLEREDLLPLADWEEGYLRLLNSIQDEGKGRKQVGAVLVSFCARISTFAGRQGALLAGLAILRLLAPDTARRLYVLGRT